MKSLVSTPQLEESWKNKGIRLLLDESSPETAPHVCVPGFRYAVPVPETNWKDFMMQKELFFFLIIHNIAARPADLVFATLIVG